MSEMPTQEINLFYCYARKDKEMLFKLKNHLISLKRQYNLRDWYDHEILAGEEWERTIDSHLDTAHLILLLISPDFMASDYCYSKEMRKAFEYHKEGKCYVIPIILRPTHWEDELFGRLQILPTNATPVTTWTNQDLAFNNIAEEISLVLKKLFILPKTAKIWLDEGISLYDLSKYNEALNAFEQALILDSFCIKAYINRDKILQQLGISREAQEQLNRELQTTRQLLADEEKRSTQLDNELQTTRQLLTDEEKRSTQLDNELRMTRKRSAQLDNELQTTCQLLADEEKRSTQFNNQLRTAYQLLTKRQKKLMPHPQTNLPPIVGHLVVIYSGSSKIMPGTLFNLNPQTTIGRGPTNTIQINESFVSVEHTRMSFNYGAWYVQDAGSTNGTFLNGEPAHNALRAHIGDIIQIGFIRFKLAS